ncbi:MAG TPA: ABC transporter ATP-binding protein [Symbiobacteriaceae bacterium]|jgi:NitT/TauT family transport system ATP-binding protein
MAVQVELKAVSRVFPSKAGPIEALSGINLTVEQGEFCVIVGPSGCGKTTLLRIIAGLDQQTSGDVVLHRLDPSRPGNTMVFQEQSVFPWMTVRQNVGYGLAMRSVPRRERDEIVDHYLAKIGLTKFAGAYPHQLSGGMKQRVSVARAFANGPEVLLMDEPFAALDEQNRALLQEELLRMWGEERRTVVFITHGLDEAAVLADRIVVLSAHPGRVKAIVPVNLPRPREVYKLRTVPEYGDLVYHLWELIREEVRPQ